MRSHLLLSSVLAVGLVFTASQARAADGATVYNQNCAMCHAPGLANSPKFGDKAAWAPRIATGKDALLKSALNGKGAMPARGGNPKLSDDDVAAAVEYMVNAAK